MKKLIFRTCIILALVVTGLIVTGHGYLLRGIYHTYLQGKTGPGIYDLHVFDNDTLLPDPSLAKPFPRSLKPLNEDQLSYLEEGETKAFLIWRSDTLRAEHYFHPHNKETHSNSFSMAKSFVSILTFMEMAKDSTFGLDSRVVDYVPFRQKGFENINLEDLLSMSSGIDWVESGKNPFSHNAKAYYGADLKDLILGLDIAHPEKEKFHYRSGNSQILAFLLEAKTGQSVPELAERQLWQKIGVSDTAFWSVDDRGNAKAFCCFYATAEDFLQVGRFVLHALQGKEPELFPQEWVESMFQSKLESQRENRNYAMHWWVEEILGQEVYYMRGILGQYIILLPHQNQVIVRLGTKRGQRNSRNHPVDLYEYIQIGTHY